MNKKFLLVFLLLNFIKQPSPLHPHRSGFLPRMYKATNKSISELTTISEVQINQNLHQMLLRREMPISMTSVLFSEFLSEKN